MEIPVDDYIARAGVEKEPVYAAVRHLATAKGAAVRVDLGIQQSLNSTLNSYLEKLLFLITGNLGKKGGNNFHSYFIPLIGHSKAGGKDHSIPTTAVTGVEQIAGLFPPNVLPAEIDTEHPERTRALFVDRDRKSVV